MNIHKLIMINIDLKVKSINGIGFSWKNKDLRFCVKPVISNVQETLTLKQSIELKTSCLLKPKLRIFVLFKEFGVVPSYKTMPMLFLARKYIVLNRLSNMAIRQETGRFDRPNLEELWWVEGELPATRI